MCVTGATGYIASFVVKQLLEEGFFVHGTVRDPSNERRTAHLWALPGARERLRLFPADLLVDGSFDAAIAGCEGVFHMASPFYLEGIKDREAEMIRPAVEGTQRVLAACAACPSVRRVVLTSSTAAIYIKDRPGDAFYDEDDWSERDLIVSQKNWYAESKLLAEQEAWRFVGSLDPARGLDLVTICPTLVLGPLLSPTTVGTSIRNVLDLLNFSKTRIPNRSKALCDVRDVADAHVRAMVDPSARGRYQIVTCSIAWRCVCDILRPVLPEGFELPAEVEPGPAPYPQGLNSQERATELGVRFTPIEVTLRDCVQSLILHNLVPRRGVGATDVSVAPSDVRVVNDGED